MKKGHSNQISIDIKKKYFFKKFILFIIFIVITHFYSCDSPQAPSWNTDITFPLIDTEYMMSDMLNDTDNNSFIADPLNDSIITILFAENIINENEIGISNDIDLSIPGMTISNSGISINENLGLDLDISIPVTPVSISIDELLQQFYDQGQNMPCIPSDSVQSYISDFGDTVYIDIPLDSINQFFNPYDYLTIKSLDITKEITSTMPFDIIFDISIVGMNNIYSSLDTIGENVSEIHNQNDEYDVFDEIVMIFDATLSNDQNYCSAQLPQNFNNQSDCENEGYIWSFPVCYSEVDGFEFNSLNEYNISFGLGITNVDIKSITGVLDGDALGIEPISGSFPLNVEDTQFGDNVISFDLMGAKITSDIIDPISQNSINTISLSYENNSPLDFELVLILDNFINPIDTTILKDTISILSNTTFEDNIYLNSYLFKHANFLENPDISTTIDELVFSSEINFPEDSKEFLIDDLDPILINIDDIDIDKVEFEYLSAAVEEFSLEQPQMTFDNIPSGFEGFLFSDPILEINIYNQIGVPSTINMELKGLDEYGNELESIVIDQSINSPDFVGSSLGLIDTTCIRIHSECIDKYSSVCGDYTCEECEENDDCESSSQSTSLSEFLQEAPNTLEISGISTLDGNGYIYPDRYVWGDFNLEVPFSLIMGDTMIVGNMDTIFNDLNIIPAQPSVLQPMDPSTQESIDSSFVGAFISSDIINHTPITGNFSLLISNNQDFFPTIIDELVTSCFDEFCTYIDTDSIDSIIELLDSESNIIDDLDMIGSFNVSEIDEIKYIPMNSNDLRVKKMEFYTPTDTLWIGRIVDFELPDIPIDADGNIIESEVNSETVISSIDEVQIGMINDSNQNQLRYINSFIRINNSYDMNGDGYLDINDDGIVNLHSSDFIKITSVVTFTINFGDF